MIKPVFTLLFLLLLSACSGPKVPLAPVPEAEVLLQKLTEEGVRWQQLDAAAEVGFHRNGRYLSTQQFMLLERPDRLRVDVMSLFGQLALQLTVNDGELQVYLNTTVPGQFYQGPASDEILARFTRLPLKSSELVQLLLHAPPYNDTFSVRVETEEEHYLLVLSESDRQQMFAFDSQLRLVGCTYLQAGEVLLQVDYDRFGKTDNFPRRVKVDMPVQQTKMSVNFSDLKLNQPAKAGRFELKPPANAVPLLLPEPKYNQGRS